MKTVAPPRRAASAREAALGRAARAKARLAPRAGWQPPGAAGRPAARGRSGRRRARRASAPARRSSTSPASQPRCQSGEVGVLDGERRRAATAGPRGRPRRGRRARATRTPIDQPSEATWWRVRRSGVVALAATATRRGPRGAARGRGRTGAAPRPRPGGAARPRAAPASGRRAAGRRGRRAAAAAAPRVDDLDRPVGAGGEARAEGLVAADDLAQAGGEGGRPRGRPRSRSAVGRL